MNARTYLIVAVVAAALNTAVALAAPPPSCDVQLSVQLTPDVQNPTDPGFLNSIVADPQYRLSWIEGTGTAATVELTGPGSDERCANGVSRLGRSGYVLNVSVIESGGGG